MTKSNIEGCSMQQDEEVVAIVKEIVRQAGKEGTLVTQHLHYPTGWAAWWMGFNLCGGACFLLFLTIALARVWHWIGI